MNFQTGSKSVVIKLYRRNIVFNKNFPRPPRDGFIEPKMLYEEIDDLVRTRLVCKYMDGPRFVCNELKRHCDSLGVESRFKELSTDLGYYAWHFYAKVPVELMFEASVEQRRMWVEIQISTQLAEVITALTHEFYETRRMGDVDPGGKEWKWDASSQQFRSAYLGHGLHLLEAIIQNLKDDLLIKGGAVQDSNDQESVPQDADDPTDERSAQELLLIQSPRDEEIG